MVIDNGLSMTDTIAEEGLTGQRPSTRPRKRRCASSRAHRPRAKSSQEMVVYLRSPTWKKPIFQGRLNSTTSAEELKQKLDGEKPTALHLSPGHGSRRRDRANLKDQPTKHRVFTTSATSATTSWVSGPEGERHLQGRR